MLLSCLNEEMGITIAEQCRQCGGIQEAEAYSSLPRGPVLEISLPFLILWRPLVKTVSKNVI